MKYIGDFAAGSVVQMPFNVVGALAGSPSIAAFIDNSATPITDGVSLSAEVGSGTKVYVASVDTSNLANFPIGSEVRVQFTAGTIGGTSAVGVIIRQFSIENRLVDAPFSQGAAAGAIDAALTTYSLHTIASAIAAIGAKTTNLPSDPADASVIADAFAVVSNTLAVIGTNTALSRQILGNKHTVVESPAGTFTINVRNDADSATVRTFVYVAATGARTAS